MSIKSLLMPAISERLLSQERLLAQRRRAERTRLARGEPHRVHYFHQTDDPYSALAAAALSRLTQRYDLQLVPHLVGAPPVNAAPERVVLIKDADLEVAAFAVDHAPVHPAVGYRIRYKDRSIVLSCDTRKSAAVQREAAGADLLVHEALSPRLVAALQQGAAAAGRPKLQQIFVDIVDHHSTPEQAAEIARDAKVGMLLLNHIAPPLPLPGMEAAFLGRACEIYDGSLRFGVDRDFVSLPAGSPRIERSRRD